MESMVFDAVLLCLAGIGLIVSFIKNREIDSVFKNSSSRFVTPYSRVAIKIVKARVIFFLFLPQCNVFRFES